MFFFLNPSTYVTVISNFLDEISNWNFYKRALETISEDGTAKKNRWIINLDEYTINTVVNLQAETLLYSDNDVRDYEMTVVSNAILECESKLSDFGMFGMVDFNTERILTSDYYAYGITGSYKFSKVHTIDIVYFIVYTLVLAGLITAAVLLLF